MTILRESFVFCCQALNNFGNFSYNFANNSYIFTNTAESLQRVRKGGESFVSFAEGLIQFLAFL